MKHAVNDADRRLSEIYGEFLPKKILDAHMHLYLGESIPKVRGTGVFQLEKALPEDYMEDGSEEDLDRVIKLILVRFEQKEKSERRGEIHIVSAGVHHADVFRRVFKSRRFGYGQSIHLGAHTNCAIAASDRGDNSAVLRQNHV